MTAPIIPPSALKSGETDMQTTGNGLASPLGYYSLMICSAAL